MDEPVAAESPTGGVPRGHPGVGPAVLLATSVALLAVAPVVVGDGYSIVEHTTSESAGQLVGGSWVARSGFVCFGLAVLWLARARGRGRLWGVAGTAAHRVFGIAIVMTAVVAARSWDPSAPYDTSEDLLHSIASFAVGAGFIVGVLLVGAHRGRATERARWSDLLALVAVVGLLLAMGLWPDLAGVLQRGMFSVAYLWYATESLGPDIRRRPR